VRALPEDTTEQEIEEIFAAFGQIEKISLLPAKRSRRSAFVTFSIWGEALDAIEALNGSRPDNLKGEYNQLGVVLAEPKPQKGNPEPRNGDNIQSQLDSWVEAKRYRDFETADGLRQELRAQGIEPEQERPNTWESSKPGEGEDAQAKLDAWVQAKRSRDFETADGIAQELRAQGIEPETERPHKWEPSKRREGDRREGERREGEDAQAKLDAWVEAKRKHDFEAADALRQELRTQGIEPGQERPHKWEPSRPQSADPIWIPRLRSHHDDGEIDAKRKRVGISKGETKKSGKIVSQGSDDPDSILIEFERLKVAYLLAMDGDGPVSAIEEVHDALLALRPMIAAIKQVRRMPSNQEPSRGGAPRDEAEEVGHRARRTPSNQEASRGGAPRDEAVRRTPSNQEASRGGASRDEAEEAGHRAGRLYISGLPAACTDEELEELLKQAVGPAELSECKVLTKKGHGKAHGYVRFVSIVAAEDAKSAMDDRYVDGWDLTLHAQWAAPRGEKSKGKGSKSSSRVNSQDDDAPRGEKSKGKGNKPSSRVNSQDDDGGLDDDGIDENRVFVSRLERGVSVEDLRYIFEQVGAVDDINLIKDKKIAFVTFSRAFDARRAVVKFDGVMEEGISREHGLSVQLAKRKE